MQLIYNIAGIIIVALIIPVFCVRAIRERGFVERIKQSFGNIPKEALDRVAQKNCIWVHAASVGEIVAGSPLIKEFRKEFPDCPILVSVVTASGYEMANRIVKDADSIIYFPIDLPWIAKKVFFRIRPRVFMPVETEMWPNFLKLCRMNNVPVLMVNGRISDRSVKQYKKMRSLLTDMIGTFSKFAMQSPIDAEYIKELGARPELVTVTGNTKYDQTYTDVSAEDRARIIKEMGLEGSDGILLAGSSHRGEEEPILKAFKALREIRPQSKLVIAPRELLRVKEITLLCMQQGFKVTTRTSLKEKPGKTEDIIILDTIGELGKVYSIGDVIYIGGSLIPHGGHNILEPAAHGKAIIVGNNMFNFKDTWALFNRRNAVITVQDGDELAKAVVDLFQDDAKRQRMEAETLAICNENKGAARKTAVILRETLEAYERDVEKRRIHSTEKITNIQTLFAHILHMKDTDSFFMYLLFGFLNILSRGYAKLVTMKLDSYRNHPEKQHELDCYVISLGNVTVGGTGKTPTAQHLAREIRDMGYKVAILNRGYRAKWHGDVGIVSDGHTLLMEAAEGGDEAYMLAKHLPEVPVVIGPRRFLTGQRAIKDFGAQVVILDDGFQHWALKRDMDILLVDAVNIFGNEQILPRGTLREPLSHIDRADVFLITKIDQAATGARDYIHSIVRKYNKDALILESIHEPRALITLPDWYDNKASDGLSTSMLQGKKVMAVSAIGNPSSFEQTVRKLGAEIIESLRYPDHHDYEMEELREIMHQAKDSKAEAIVITEKDAVKVPPRLVKARWPVPVFVVCVEVTFKDGNDQFRAMLQRELEEHVGPPARKR